MVEIYFIQKGALPTNAMEFFRIHEENCWTTFRGKPIRNWKAWANEWIWSLNRKKKKIADNIGLIEKRSAISLSINA